jgi:hypothetical protein
MNGCEREITLQGGRTAVGQTLPFGCTELKERQVSNRADPHRYERNQGVFQSSETT